MGAIKALQTMDDDELYVYAKEIRAPGRLGRTCVCVGVCVSAVLLRQERLQRRAIQRQWQDPSAVTLMCVCARAVCVRVCVRGHRMCVLLACS